MKKLKSLLAATIALTCATISTLTFSACIDFSEIFAGQNSENTTDESGPANFKTPTDNSLPTDHTGIENVGYMNNVLQKRKFWTVRTLGEESLPVSDLNVESVRQFYNGVYIFSDFSSNTIYKRAYQYCYVKGGNTVLQRSSESIDNNSFEGITWRTDAPSKCSLESSINIYGWRPDNYFEYVINANTVKNYSSATDNGDGTYSQTFDLNTATEPQNNSAVLERICHLTLRDNVRGIEFNSVSVTYTFDGGWNILRVNITENFDTSTPFGTISTASAYKLEFSYEENDAKNSFYSDYFQKYYLN